MAVEGEVLPDSSATLEKGEIRAKRTEYVVVARRYRPQTFDELIGQQHVARALRNAIETNRVGHAYLFTGARGVGKTSAARILSKALNCSSGPTATPCGECDVCRSVASGGDVDVLEIDGASNRGIDEIRQLRSNVNVRPSRARFKVYIIDEVHMLTKEAFNALLKTLEEPPEHVKFIFCTTDPEKIPITVLSRCQRFDFAPVELNAIVDRLQEIVTAEGATADPDALEMLARRAAGSMRDSQSLLEQLLSFAGEKITSADIHRLFGTAESGRVATLVANLRSRDAAGALAEVDAAVREGVDIGQLAEQVVGHLRDMMAAAVGCDGGLLLHNPPAQVEALRQQAQDWGLQTMLASLQIMDEVVAGMRQSMHRRTLVEMAVVRIANLDDLQQLSDVIAQLGSEGNSEPVSRQPAARPVPSAKKKDAVTGNGGTPMATHHEATEPARRSTPTAADGRQPSPNTTADAAPPHQLSIDSAEPSDIWRQAVSSLGGVFCDVAADVQTVEMAGKNGLVVSFASAYSCSFCQRPERLVELERAVANVVGDKIRLEFRHESPPPRPSRDRPRGVSMRELVRQSYEQPLVRQAVELFDAEVTRVQPPHDNQS
jgi:DNA polymerase-3 subunit gamma/tau